MSTPPRAAEDIEDRDPGLARERTDLAWTRTGISFAALGAAMLRNNIAAGASALAAGTIVWVLGQLAAGTARPTNRRQWLTHRRILRLISIVTTLVALLAFIVALLAPAHGHH